MTCRPKELQPRVGCKSLQDVFFYFILFESYPSRTHITDEKLNDKIPR